MPKIALAMKIRLLDKIKNVKEEQINNSAVNDREFNSRQIMLKSSPNTIFIQAAGPCNSSCAFCSRGTDYEIFNLTEHRRRFEERFYPFISKAETLVFTGSGEFLLLPEAEEILDFFDKRFPDVQKQFSTNGSTLNKGICEKIIASPGKYTIHVSLHASNIRLHKVLTRTENFPEIIKQIKYLLGLRNDSSRLELRLIFVANTINIEDLPGFVKMAYDLGADRVISYYNYIYVPAQKYLSCFFKQDLTNRIFDEAEIISKKLGIPLDLPPRFGLNNYPRRDICREPWAQIMTDAAGQVLPCDASEDCNLNITKAQSFMDDIWNSQYYQELRQALIEKRASCFNHCFRANPAAVNDFSSHVIHRGRNEEINILWGDNF